MKRRLNKKGKLVITLLSLLVNLVIYVLMAKFGEFAQYSIFIQFVFIMGWIWLLVGQFWLYFIIWEDSVK